VLGLLKIQEALRLLNDATSGFVDRIYTPDPSCLRIPIQIVFAELRPCNAAVPGTVKSRMFSWQDLEASCKVKKLTAELIERGNHDTAFDPQFPAALFTGYRSSEGRPQGTNVLRTRKSGAFFPVHGCLGAAGA
jgi:hypothetical protein